jgi:hypothetical protein
MICAFSFLYFLTFFYFNFCLKILILLCNFFFIFFFIFFFLVFFFVFILTASQYRFFHITSLRFAFHDNIYINLCVCVVIVVCCEYTWRVFGVNHFDCDFFLTTSEKEVFPQTTGSGGTTGSLLGTGCEAVVVLCSAGFEPFSITATSSFFSACGGGDLLFVGESAVSPSSPKEMVPNEIATSSESSPSSAVSAVSFVLDGSGSGTMGGDDVTDSLCTGGTSTLLLEVEAGDVVIVAPVANGEDADDDGDEVEEVADRPATMAAAVILGFASGDGVVSLGGGTSPSLPPNGGKFIGVKVGAGFPLG